MKKLSVICMFALMLSAILPVQSNAAKASVTATATTATTVATAAQIDRANKLTARIYEINAMDKSALSYSEKKALRKEVRAMKKEIREGNGGIYLSVGAIIIIILLLILIL
jgi:guanyl-specific ribonuclease Sa